MGVKLLQLASTPEQQPKVCSWEWDSHQCWTKFPVCTSHCYFIYCSWPSLQPVSCIKIQMWKTLPASSLNYFFLLLLFGGKKGAFFFFLFPFNFLFIVECIKWSKASFRLTKFKNYFLCSDAFVWKFIPVCTRQETRMWSFVHALGLRAEELRRRAVFGEKAERR